MKTFRKALSIILGLAIMLSCVMGMQVSVAAEETATETAALVLEVGDAVVDGSVVKVPVVVAKNDGFQALAVTVGYEEAVLDLVLPTEDTPAKNADFTTAKDSAVTGPDVNPFKLMWAFAEETANVTATGTIATLTFDVVDDSVESTEITLNVTEAWDVDGNEVAVTTTAGTVEFVKEPVYDPSLASALYSKTVQITSKVGTMFTLYMPNVDFDDFQFIVSKPKMPSPSYTYNGDSDDTIFDLTNYYKNSVPESKLYQYAYSNVGLYEMNSDITCTLYIIKDGQRVSYYTWDTFKLVDLVEDYYGRNLNDAKNAGLAVAILNLGTDAQVHFAAEATKAGYADNTLSKAPALNTEVDQSLLPDYGELPTYTTQKDAAIYGATVQLLAAPSLRYTVYDANMTEVCKNPANVTIQASYESEVLNAEETNVSVNGAALSDADKANASLGMYTYTFSEVALYDADEVVTFTFSGTDSTSYSCKLTLMTLIAARVNDTGTAGDVYRSLATLWAAASNKFK